MLQFEVTRDRIYTMDEVDDQMFPGKLKDSLEVYNVSFSEYVCMWNHFYFLLKTTHGNFSDFMRHFNIACTLAFNRRHNRSGHLYQGRYKSFLIDADNYLRARSKMEKDMF